MNLTMKLRRCGRAALLLLACASLPAALTRCGAAVDEGTETGNPPVIQKWKLRLVARGDELRVVGEPGALPAGASVRITNQRSGAVLEATAGSDGALDVVVEGEHTDTFELVVVTASGEASITLSRTDLPLDLSTLSCDGLRAAKDNVVAAAFAEADQTCTTDFDCTSEIWGALCYDRCASFVASRDGFATSARDSERSVEPLCEQERRSGCPGDPVPVCGGTPAVLCESNRCVALDRAELDCVELGREAVRERQAQVDRAFRECQVDADCALVTGSHRCLPDCGFVGAVAAGAAVLIEPSLRALDDGLCAQLESADCAGAFPPCTSPAGTSTPACVEGQCQVRFEPAE